jgi:hypothetical protein
MCLEFSIRVKLHVCPSWSEHNASKLQVSQIRINGDSVNTYIKVIIFVGKHSFMLKFRKGELIWASTAAKEVFLKLIGINVFGTNIQCTRPIFFHF